MKWTELLRKDNYALLQSETDTQYVVVSGYDPTQPEDQQWASGTYFEYWNDAKRKADCLQSALNYLSYLRSRTKTNMININTTINKENIRRAMIVLIDNGIEESEAGVVLDAIGCTLLDTHLDTDGYEIDSNGNLVD